MEKLKKATKGQRDRIEGMLKSGLIDRDEAQELIKKQRVAKVVGLAPDPVPVDWNLAYWEERFPGSGESIMEVLRPFSKRLTLKQALPDLETVAKKAVFWREIKGVRKYRRSLMEYLLSSIRKPHMFLHPTDYRQRLETTLGSWRSGQFVSAFHERVSLFMDPNVEDLRGPLKRVLADVAHLALAKQQKEVDKFKAVLDLWLSGNFPVGFDEEGYLLVLVAD